LQTYSNWDGFWHFGATSRLPHHGMFQVLSRLPRNLSCHLFIDNCEVGVWQVEVLKFWYQSAPLILGTYKSYHRFVNIKLNYILEKKKWYLLKFRKLLVAFSIMDARSPTSFFLPYWDWASTCRKYCRFGTSFFSRTLVLS
jgi:hypothetical protein